MAGIFDKAVAGINKGVASVGASSKAMVEKARIKTVIGNLEKEKAQLAELLGMKIYEKHTQSGVPIEDAGMANFITEIGKRIDQIAAQQAEMRRIDEEVSMVTGSKARADGLGKSCACGNVNDQGSKFCAKCGNAL